MKYKFTYLVFKVRKVWDILTLIFAVSWLGFTCAVIFFAVIFQIALVYFLFLLIFLIQTLRMSCKFYTIMANQRKDFRDYAANSEEN
jgi:hypothetical protein